MRKSPRDYYDHLISEMPAGVERAVLSVLRFHIGAAAAIHKPDLIREVARLGFHLKDERQVRLAIQNLRDLGYGVEADSSESGYYLADPRQLSDFYAFTQREYWSKIRTMTRRVRAMEERIARDFPAEYEAYQRAQAEQAGQPSLI
jgi:hypothetical protein